MTLSIWATIHHILFGRDCPDCGTTLLECGNNRPGEFYCISCKTTHEFNEDGR